MEVIATIQVRDGGGLDLVKKSRAHRKSSDSGYMLEVGPTEFTIHIFCWAAVSTGLTINEMGKTMGGAV